MNGFGTRPLLLGAVAVAAGLSAGCTIPLRDQQFEPPAVPKELNKVNHPEYRVEPPDILLIEAVRTIPKPPYRAESLDVLFVELVEGGDPASPLRGQLSVDPDGTVDLGREFGGKVTVIGKTLAEIELILARHLERVLQLKKAVVRATLLQGRAAQRISGPHLVRQDGKVALGTYGDVRVSGMTLAETRKAIEDHLSQFLAEPEIFVDVQSYNSKIYYVIFDGAGAAQTIRRAPITGNETVLDAIGEAGGLTAVSSPKRVWIARPAPEGAGCQILPVDWNSIVMRADPATNYQILPGDRVFVGGYPATTFSTRLARAVEPFERVFGVILLGQSVYNTFRFAGFNQFGGGFGGGFPGGGFPGGGVVP